MRCHMQMTQVGKASLTLERVSTQLSHLPRPDIQNHRTNQNYAIMAVKGTRF
jgi:hypothetical protein